MTTSETITAPRSATVTESDRESPVLVVELDDVAPRRHSDLPNLYVGVTVEPHETKLDHIESGAKPKWVRGHVVRLRPDLFEGYGATTSEEAKRQKKALAVELSRRGYTVNKESNSMWRLYVVQLDESAVADAGEGWVYVGESSLSPEDRLEQHLSGARNLRGPLYSRRVRAHGQHLRWDLMRGQPALYSQDDSKLAEAALAEVLREQGYVVEGGH